MIIINSRMFAFKKELEVYEGYVPKLLHYCFSTHKQLQYLKKVNYPLYKEVSKKYLECRRELLKEGNFDTQENVNELLDWIKLNPQFSQGITYE